MSNGQTRRVVVDENGDSYTLIDVVGSGGQGTVWKVNGDSRIVVKTLTDSDTGDIVCDEEVYDGYAKKIRSLIALSVLEDIQNISVPITMLKKPMCGYVMRFMEGMEQLGRQKAREKSYISKVGLNSSLKKKYKVMRNVVDTVRKIHNSGLVYCDFSANNVFLSKGESDYEAWLIDPDNLTYASKNKNCIFTMGYGAPEIYEGHKNTIYSDMYSVAVVLFEYLTGSKPFIRKENLDAQAEEDEFVSLSALENPVDNSEVYMYEDSSVEKSGVPAEYVFTDEIYDLFMRTFGKTGRENPSSRPSANDWYEAINDALDLITLCSNNHYHLSNKCVWCSEEGCKEDDGNKYFSISIEAIPNYEERIDEDWCNNDIVSCYYPYNNKKCVIYVEKSVNKQANEKYKEFQNIPVFNGFFDNVENYDALVSYDEKNVRLRICDDKGNQVHKVIWNYHSEKVQVIRIAGIERNYIISFCWGE